MFKNMDGNIPGGNFPGENFPGGSFPDTLLYIHNNYSNHNICTNMRFIFFLLPNSKSSQFI